MPRLDRYALIVCLLAAAAAVVSFVNGSWVGVVWVLLAGLTSNMWWYYRRKAKLDEQQARARAAAEAAGPAAAVR
jgi:membrane protein implicated in regulation of membrane protease activity